jgi:MoaA/NifB/PqqE/SkfB family radical SAM enzyme
MTITPVALSRRANPLQSLVRSDLPGRFNELDVLRRQWPLFSATLDGTVLPPYEVLIHPSSRCNLRCTWCIGDHVPIERWDEEDQELAVLDAAKTACEVLPDRLAGPENMTKLVEGIAAYRVVAPYRQGGEEREGEFRVQNVSFSGLIGEPLVAKRALLPAMRFLVENGMRVGLFTNGVLMDEEVIETLVRIGYVHLSLDAGTPATYARVKFGGRSAGEVRFHQAVSNLRRLVERRRETGSQLTINSSFVLYPETHHEVYEAAVLLKDIGVETLRLKRDISNDRPLEPGQVPVVAELIRRIEDELVDDSFQLVTIHPFTRPQDMVRSFSTCSITNMMAAVGSDGCLYPCNYHPRPGGWSYGSAIERPFREVWEGGRRLELRGQLPGICPKVCDPFKNRSNRLLARARDVAAADGPDRLEQAVEELLGAQVYEF